MNKLKTILTILLSLIFYNSFSQAILNTEAMLKEIDSTFAFKLNVDGYMKIGGNLIYEISNGLSLKLYYDSEPGNDEFNVTNVGYFIGYDKNKTRVGLEYNKINNAKSYNSPSLDNNLSGFSGYISQNFSENSSVFFRYDSLESNIVSGSSEPVSYTHLRAHETG